MGILLVMLWLVVLGAKQERQRFEQRFPRLSDQEFLIRCRPGTNPSVALKVRELVAFHFGMEYSRIHPSLRFIRDLGAD